MTADLRALLADAERYRWLRNQMHGNGRADVYVAHPDAMDWENVPQIKTPDALDAAIDAVRGE